MISLSCRQCSATFERMSGKKGAPPAYCSDPCRMAARGYKTVGTHGMNGYKHGCRCEVCSDGARDGMRQYFRDRGGNPHRKITEKFPCKGGCDKMLRAGTCRDCTARVRAAKNMVAARRRRAQEKLRAAERGSRASGMWVQGRCASCGEDFTRRSSGVVVPFCSNRCRTREARRDRRALEAGAKLTQRRRWVVFERDDWTCKLCGFPVRRDAAVPDLEAPVIDHVIALARGGAHGEDNWQTAHFLCNSYKRDLDMAEVA